MITVETLGSSSKGNCYRLLSGGRSLLLECGLPWREIRKKLNFQTTDLDGCLVSHQHLDHFGAAVDVLKAGVDLYAASETLELKDMHGHHNAHKVEHGKAVFIEQYWKVRPFELEHDVPTFGFVVKDRVDTLIFLADTAYCKWRFFLDPPSILMIEANFSEPILKRNIDSGLIDPSRAKRVRENHMSIERVIDFLKANDLSRCRAIHLIHLSDGNSDAELFKRMVQESTGIPTFVEG